MDKINFENLPSTTTPINADKLNQMQTNIENEFSNKQGKIEYGNWQPRLIDRGGDGDPTVTYDYNTSKYFKIGNLVIALFRFRGKITELKGSNYAAIGGLPYPAILPVANGSFSSVYNLLTKYDGSELPQMPTMILDTTTQSISIQDGSTLGSTVARFKLSGDDSFECFGGVIYITN